MRTLRPSHHSSRSQILPALQSALTFLIPIIALRFLSSVFVPGIWWLLILSVAYLLNGYTAGRLYALSIYHARVRQAAANAVQQGAGAGILLFILGWIGYAILVVLIKLFVPFTSITQVEALLVCGGVLEFLAALGLGAFGASRYR
ncbi:MAG TPA: hypothetical protein VHP14_08980 [Anaerolineales bacterium]|nr:hypothetical protein [Anaerolineales bacterium]